MSRPRQPELDERLADFVDGRLSARDRERFEAELRVNATLRQRVEEYRRTIEVMQQALRQPVVKVDVAAAVLDKIQRGVVVPTTPLPWQHASRRALWLSGAVAAAAGLLLFALFRWEPAPARTDGVEQRVTDLDTAAVPPAENLMARLEQAPPAAATEPTIGFVTSGAPAANAPRPDAPALEPDVDAAKLKAPDDPVAVDKAATPGMPGTFGLPIVTAATMVPQVRFSRAGAAGELPPVGADAAPMVQFFADARLGSLAETLRAGQVPLQVLRLEALPADLQQGAPTDQRGNPSTGPTGEAEAWLVEGSGPDVYDYLARLSEAGRGLGYVSSNGEVAAAEVARLLPRSADETALAASRNLVDQVGGRDDDRAGSRAAQPGQSDRGAPERDALEALQEEAKKQAETGSAEQVRKERRFRGVPAGDPAPKDTSRDTARDAPAEPAGAPAPTAGLPAVVPATPGAPEPSAPPRVRLVIVIDRAARPQPR